MLRELRVDDEPAPARPGRRLRAVAWAAAERCCGFGGLFSVKLPEMSVAMADDKLATLAATDADVARRRATARACCTCAAGPSRGPAGRSRRHLAEVLAAALPGRELTATAPAAGTTLRGAHGRGGRRSRPAPGTSPAPSTGSPAAGAGALAELDDADGLRRRPRAIRADVLADLPGVLAQLADSVSGGGGHVCWAADGADANALRRRDRARAPGRRPVVKSKSMATEEIGLNAALEAAGCRVVETDLGEWIIQLARETPSHIIAPAMHHDRHSDPRRVRGARQTRRSTSTTVPEELTAFARAQLRQEFLAADIGITGVNFGVAETGSIVLVTNEGNGRMVTSLPRVHVAVHGHGAARAPLGPARPAAHPAGPVGHRPAAVDLHQRHHRPAAGRRGRRARRAARRDPRQRPQRPARAPSSTRCSPASAAAPASTSARCTARSAATPTAGSTRADGRGAHAAAGRRAPRGGRGLRRVDAVRRLHGRLPGADPAAGPAARPPPAQGGDGAGRRAGGVAGWSAAWSSPAGYRASTRAAAWHVAGPVRHVDTRRLARTDGREAPRPPRSGSATGGRAAMERAAFLDRLRDRLAGGSGEPRPSAAGPSDQCRDRPPLVDRDDLVATFERTATAAAAWCTVSTGGTCRRIVAALVERHGVGGRSRRGAGRSRGRRHLAELGVAVSDPDPSTRPPPARRHRAVAAIAATGSVVLDSRPPAAGSPACCPGAPVHRPRRPVGGRPGGRAPRPHALPSNLVFVTGPSRTGDIEQIITLGVHGPVALHVVLLGT